MRSMKRLNMREPCLALGLALFGALAGCSDGAVGRRQAAQEGEREATALTPTELLRVLSLDLRGAPPSAEEYRAVVEAGQIPDALIGQMLESQEFLDRIETWHAELLWPNIRRYRVTPMPLAGVQKVGGDHPEWIGAGPHGVGDRSGPSLIDDPGARERYVMAFESEATGVPIRGGAHAYSTHFCDLSPEAEYPAPEVVGTPGNRYRVPAERSGTGRAYTRTFYSEDPERWGAVLPLYDSDHCPNYCYNPACGDPADVHYNLDEDGDRDHDCYSDMDTPGSDPAGPHELDPPSMRCPDGWQRVINPCDFQAVLGEDGQPRRPRRWSDVTNRGTNYNMQRDGWRWMVHYWSEGVPIRTCAVEAQEREVALTATDHEGQPLACSQVLATSRWSYRDASCGCGPQGIYCSPSQKEHRSEYETLVERRLRSAIEREPLRIIRSVVEGDEDYLSILTTRRSFVNGPLAAAWRDQAGVMRGEGGIRVDAPAENVLVWDDVDYASEEWVAYERPERHSGVLTTHAFLFRFPTFRARVAQYRREFLCSSEFDYAPEPDPADTHPDIAERRGCGGCHARLEQDGMWFARYPDRTGEYYDPERFPVVNEACAYCAERGRRFCSVGRENPHVEGGVVTDPGLSGRCNTHYVMSAPEGYEDHLGRLKATLFRDEEMLPRLAEGPRAMVAVDEGTGALERCAARTAWNRLVRRAPTEAELDALVAHFMANGRSYRALIAAVVASEAYQTREAM